MQGYYVLVTPPAEDSVDEVNLVALMRKSKLVDLKSTRTFNKITEGHFHSATQSAVNKIRNSKDEQQKKRQEYYKRPEVIKHRKEYYTEPRVKERKKEARKLASKMLKLTPKEIKLKVMKEHEMEVEEEKAQKAQNTKKAIIPTE